ncbi:MAG: flagellar export chaperone FlgN, partial [Deltaproteobacteria bacterium]|nr:flagellar export chaperone FlgN [Deltaproteobacteria bacterium]
MAAKSNSEAPSLLQTLLAEAEAVRVFVEILQVEQIELKNGKTENLPDFAEKKSQIGLSLNQLSAQRNTMLAASGFSNDRAGIEAWCLKHPEEKRVNET